MKFIHKYKSANFNYRKKGSSIDYIIIHYTALLDYKTAINHLCNTKKKVSSHFLITKKGEIYNLVSCDKRAWHAGKSYWKGETDINSNSIGIELDNSGHHNKFEKYTIQQIESLEKLINFISKKYTIPKTNILGHSDIAPYRKIDPGQKFQWKKLAKNKIGFFPKTIELNKKNSIEKLLNSQLGNSKKIKSLFMLNSIGYNIYSAKRNVKCFKKLIKIYQMHFRPKIISGKLDEQTYELIKSHYNEVLT